MKKLVFFLVMVLFSFSVYAQNSATVEQATKNISEEVTTIIEEGKTENPSVSENTPDSAAATEETKAQEEQAPEPEVTLSEEEVIEKYMQEKAEYEKKVEQIKAFYLEKFKTAPGKKETVEAELGQAVEIQAEKDKLRLSEEELYALRRSPEETEELNRRLSSVEFLITEKKAEAAQKNGPEESILTAETIKNSIWALREDVKNRSEAFNNERQADVEAQIEKLNNTPFGDGETDSYGEPTRTAIQRRANHCKDLQNEANLQKTEYLKQLQAEIAPAEKQYFSDLKSAYHTVEAGKYVTNSLTDDIIFRVQNFDAEKGIWHATVTSGLFGYTTLLNMDFDLTYEEVTGKKFISADLMSDEQFAEFKNNVALYDYLFRKASPYIFVRVYFVMYHWKETSEYRFTPSRLEVLKMGDSIKVIHKENRVQAKSFVNYTADVHEVRTNDEILKDSERAAKIVEKEQKKAGTYNPAFAYNGRGKDFIQQKGRGSVNFTGGIVRPPKDPPVLIDDFTGELTFGIGKHAFIGGDFGLIFPINPVDLSVEYGIVGGANVKIGEYLRPYLKATGNLNNRNNLIIKAGIGTDITLDVFMFNIGYDYSFYFDMNKDSSNVSVSTKPVSQKHRFSFGIGIAF